MTLCDLPGSVAKTGTAWRTQDRGGGRFVPRISRIAIWLLSSEISDAWPSMMVLVRLTNRGHDNEQIY